MKVLSLQSIEGNYFPSGLQRLEYQSAIDGFEDWALLLPGKNPSDWIIVLHGHGSGGDQLFTRRDIREAWLPHFLDSGAGIATFNLRGNAWMCPAAAADLHDFLQWMREEQCLQRTLFYSGSMGGTSNLIYAVLHPEDVNAVVALGAATDIPTYYAWCLQQTQKTPLAIAQAIETAYEGTPDTQKVLFKQHSTLQNAARLTMPVYLAHGAADVLIPVLQARNLAQAMRRQKYFYYSEISNGDHDAPLWDKGALDFLKREIGGKL